MDPVVRSPYFTEWLIPIGAWARRMNLSYDPALDWVEFNHVQMRRLRDGATLVGVIRDHGLQEPPRNWRFYVYVSRSSPHHDALVAALKPVLAPPP